MKSFKPVVATILLMALLITIQVFAQDSNPNCPDGNDTEINYCNNIYEYEMIENENEMNYWNASCDNDYETLVDESVDLYQRGRSTEEEYLAELDQWAEELVACNMGTFNTWVDANMRSADNWNYCLCENGGCDYYCDL